MWRVRRLTWRILQPACRLSNENARLQTLSSRSRSWVASRGCISSRRSLETALRTAVQKDGIEMIRIEEERLLVHSLVHLATLHNPANAHQERLWFAIGSVPVQSRRSTALVDDVCH